MTAEQQRIAEALRELCQPILNEEDPGCCPFTLVGLTRMWHRNPELYSMVADYHGWPTNLANPNHPQDGQAYCRGAVTFRSQRALFRHVEALARRAPPFYSPPSIPPNPVEDDSEEDFGQDDNDDDDARNLQAHVVLLHQLNTNAA